MHLTRDPINVSNVMVTATNFGGRAAPFGGRDDGQNFPVGASLLFLGIVRNDSEGKSVLYLEYEAYEEMAERMLEELVNSVSRKWPVEAANLLHRLGRVEAGEIAVAVAVESAHRREAYEASRFMIEKIKRQVPIWKKEYFADGTSVWSQCPHVELQRSP